MTHQGFRRRSQYQALEIVKQQNIYSKSDCYESDVFWYRNSDSKHSRSILSPSGKASPRRTPPTCTLSNCLLALCKSTFRDGAQTQTHIRGQCCLPWGCHRRSPAAFRLKVLNAWHPRSTPQCDETSHDAAMRSLFVQVQICWMCFCDCQQIHIYFFDPLDFFPVPETASTQTSTNQSNIQNV